MGTIKQQPFIPGDTQARIASPQYIRRLAFFDYRKAFMTTASAPVVVNAPDSFKGSLSAQEVAEAIGAGVRAAAPSAIVRLCPIADGGEGTLEALLHAGGEVRRLRVRGAAGALRDAAAGILSDGSAVIESAEIVGLTDHVGTAVAVENRSTLGIGDALLTLLDGGARRFLIALGGSSTNDGGIGMLVALGLKLFDADGATRQAGTRGRCRSRSAAQ
jgi:glycerate kinase